MHVSIFGKTLAQIDVSYYLNFGDQLLKFELSAFFIRKAHRQIWTRVRKYPTSSLQLGKVHLLQKKFVNIPKPEPINFDPIQLLTALSQVGVSSQNGQKNLLRSVKPQDYWQQILLYFLQNLCSLDASVRKLFKFAWESSIFCFFTEIEGSLFIKKLLLVTSFPMLSWQRVSAEQ